MAVVIPFDRSTPEPTTRHRHKPEVIQRAKDIINEEIAAIEEDEEEIAFLEDAIEDAVRDINDDLDSQAKSFGLRIINRMRRNGTILHDGDYAGLRYGQQDLKNRIEKLNDLNKRLIELNRVSGAFVLAVDDNYTEEANSFFENSYEAIEIIEGHEIRYFKSNSTLTTIPN